jgi:3D (Asp-Asp-Asp) domain-containing protein
MIDDYNYIMKIPGAVCTSYSGSDLGASGLGCEYDKTCASHNLPYGTKIYIPQLKEALGGDGVLTVTDTGSFFDF